LFLVPHFPFYLPLFLCSSIPHNSEKDPARPFAVPPLPFLLKLSQTLLTASPPVQTTAHHTASTFYATQEKEQEAGKIRVVVIVAQDNFVFCKSCGLKKARVSSLFYIFFSRFAIFQ
jgi:hypothetical protein